MNQGGDLGMQEDGYTYVWEYRIHAQAVREFLGAYGPEGTWVRLFRKVPGYIGTRLLQDLQELDRYLTIDQWESEAAFLAFRERYAREFEALDQHCEAFTRLEAELGRFREVRC